MRPDLLHVVTCISNPVRYRSRWRLYERFLDRMLHAGVPLTTVELTYGERHSEIAEIIERVTAAIERIRRPSVQHIRLDSEDELWHKENLLNIGARQVDARYIAFVDADIVFQNTCWAAETVERLQLFNVVQLFSHALDLDPDCQPLLNQPARTGLAYGWRHGLPDCHRRYGGYWHPGYAWAMRRQVFEDLGGLIDCAIVGAADWHMARSFIGDAAATLKANYTEGYKGRVLAFQERCERYVERDVGYVPGLITHEWHGKKIDRGYPTRSQILIEHRFDPTTDLSYNHAQGGLIEWSHMTTPRLRALRDDVRRYLRSRNEDSIDIV